jgi:hypothetical protein
MQVRPDASHCDLPGKLAETALLDKQAWAKGHVKADHPPAAQGTEPGGSGALARRCIGNLRQGCGTRRPARPVMEARAYPSSGFATW